MTDVSPMLSQLQEVFGQQFPPDALSGPIPIALVCLVGGVGLSVVGAKLAKPGIATLFGLVGVSLGIGFARETGWSMPACALTAGAMFAVIAFLTFRLWVGLMAGVVISSVALGVFGYQRLSPHVTEFKQTMTWTPPTQQLNARAGTTGATLPIDPVVSPRQWVEQFWTFVKERDASVERNGRLLGLAVMVGGLFLGVIAVRWMLILSTSCLGTTLVVSSVLTLLTRIVPSSYQALERNPGVMGIGMGGFLVTSLIVQTLLTRKAPANAKSSGNS